MFVIMNAVMNKALTVSIVIPVFNEESYIATCLESIACQSVLPDEVIVVDNNSTDATVDIVKRFPFVTLLHESEQGVLAARRTGFDAVSSDIIARIDADTILSSNWVETVIAAFATGTIEAASGPNGYHDFVLPKAGLRLEHVMLRGALSLGYSVMFGCNMAIRSTTWHMIADEVCQENHVFEDIDIADHLLEHGIKTAYVRDMEVMVSSRRLASDFVSFKSYIGAHVRTAKHHNKSTLGARYAETMFLIGYVLFKPLHMAYDPFERRFSLRQFLSESNARPDPMAYERD